MAIKVISLADHYFEKQFVDLLIEDSFGFI